MESRHTVEKRARAGNGFVADREIVHGFAASPAETAEYLAQMASELVTLARTARLERLSLLLDFVRREAEAEAESAA